MLPGFERVAGQPPADRGRRDRDLAAGGQFAGQLRPLHFASGTPDSAGSAHASAITPARSAAVNTGGRPLRGASVSPATRLMANRRRHLRTVSAHTPRSAATAAVFRPAAAASTIRARSQSRYSPRNDRARAASTARSPADKTIWYGPVPCIAPFELFLLMCSLCPHAGAIQAIESGTTLRRECGHLN